MTKNRMFLTLAVSGILLAGCDTKKDTATPAAPSSSTPTVPAAPAMPTVTVTPPTSLPAAITPSIPAVPDAAPTVTTPAVPSTPALPTTPATPAAPGATGDVNADAKATLAQFGKDLVAKDWKAAGADLKTLNDEKDKLSPELKDSVKQAQTQYDAAKAASSLKIPGLGGGDSNK